MLLGKPMERKNIDDIDKELDYLLSFIENGGGFGDTSAKEAHDRKIQVLLSLREQEIIKGKAFNSDFTENSIGHIGKVWKALVAVEEFLRHGLPQKLITIRVTNPKDWTVLHEAVGIIREERLYLPNEVYVYIDTHVLPELQSNLNSLLGILRKAATSRDAVGELGEGYDESSYISELNDSLQLALSCYAKHLEYLHSRFLEIMERKKVASSGNKYINIGGITMGNEGDTYNIGQAGAAGRYARSDNNTFIQSEEKKTLAEAAAEIQQLLKQLEYTNPSATEAEKIAYVNDETTPSFKRRAVGALQAAGEAAIEEFLDNPYVNVGKALVKGWMKPESFV
jgi:hypothetical protein